MSLGSLLVRNFLGLKKPETGKILVERNIPVTMRDGVVLYGDRYYSADGIKRPLVLVRSFYGRKNFFGLVLGRLIAEQGFQVFIQSCRGTYDSRGELLPLLTEKDDGIDTVEWIKEQEWYPGYFATTGPSYLGYVQWAIASDTGDEHKAMALQITASNFRGMGFPGDSFALNTVLTWMYLVNHLQSDFHSVLAYIRMRRKLRRAFNHFPLKDLDNLVLGRQVDFWQLLLVMGDSEEGEVTAADYSASISDLNVPVSMQGGWYDIFLPWKMKDFAALQHAGKNPRIVVGPWTHINLPGGAEGLKDSISWLRINLLNDDWGEREYPVKLFVMGANEWRNYKEWPPQDCKYQRYYLHGEGILSTSLPGKSQPDEFIYDPSNPTPALGGPTLFEFTGCRNNRNIEKRDDILTFDSDIFEESLEITGPVSAELFISSSLEYTDFFVRLCDVYPSGKSLNICDGLQRIKPGRFPAEEGNIIKVTIEMWPTAHFFRRGHRMRLQVSSGAHPRYARNPGCGGALSGACELKVAHQKVYHDNGHTSSVILPVVERDDSGNLKGVPVKCIWCNDDDGIFKEIKTKDKKKLLHSEEKSLLAVHPRHEKKTLNHISAMEKYGNVFFIALIINLFLVVSGLAVNISVLFFIDEGYLNIWLYAAPPVIVLSLILLAFPFVPLKRMFLYAGVRRTVLMLRIIATGTMVTAVSQLI